MLGGLTPNATAPLTAATPERRRRRARPHLSIRSKMLLAFLAIIIVMGAANVAFITSSLEYRRQYEAIITNITTANRFNGYIKPSIDTMMWNVVAGKVDFADSGHEELLDEVTSTLTSMMESTDSEKGAIKLGVILRTMETLTHYVDLLGEQTARGAPVVENEAVLENIRGVSELVQDLVQEYMLFEVNRSEEKYRELQRDVERWMASSGLATLVALILGASAAWLLSRSVYLPIRRLHDVTTTLAQQDLEGLVSSSNADEIDDLRASFNVMVGKIRELLAFKLREQENLKKYEFRLLQAQINPHFLYNTLDTIIWQAQGNNTRQVVQLVRDLSAFFRTSLNRGEDWIPVRDEVEHVKSYLAIQSVRYRDILDYEIDVDEALMQKTMLKLLLQPLVENALYHGIKNKRGGGTILVRGRMNGNGAMLFEVEDDGIGIAPDRVARLQRELVEETDMEPSSEAGFGLHNVNNRLRLYYGVESGITLSSRYLHGTTVQVRIPLVPRSEAVAPSEAKGPLDQPLEQAP
jgi:two-component system sensor histidine kinase YesM